MEDQEALGFEHMGLDPRLLQVWGRLWSCYPVCRCTPRRLSCVLFLLRLSPIWAGRDLR